MSQSNNKYNNLTLLVAEDDELSYLYLKIILKSITKYFTRVKSGKEVLDYLESSTVDIVLLDVNLLDGSGLEIAKVIFEKHPKVGIILNSAFSLEDEWQYAMKKYNFHYLSKPLEKEKMLFAIEKVLCSVDRN